MSKEDANQPVSISGSITDVLGAGKGVSVLVSAIERGVGKVLGPWQRKRENLAEVENLSAWASVLRDQGLQIGGGDLSLGDRTIVRLTVEAMRIQGAREAIAVEAVQDFKRLTENSDEMPEPTTPEPEWVDRFWRLAGEVSSEQMRSLWGRVLARKVASKSQIGARTLDFLSTLSSSDANLIAQLGRFVCEYDTLPGGPTALPQKAGLIRTVTDLPAAESGAAALYKKLVAMTEELDSPHLGSIGVYYESSYSFEAFSRIADDGHVHIKIGGKRFVLYSYVTPLQDKHRRSECHLGNGAELTRLGHELLSLIDAEPDSEYVKTIGELYGIVGWILRPEKKAQ